MSGVTLREGDIVDEEVDALVSPANTALEARAGVGAAISAQAGDALRAACKASAPVALGSATETPGGALRAAWVFHAALMETDGQASEDSVRESFRGCLVLAESRDTLRLAVPALGSAEGGLSIQRVAEILLEEARGYFDDAPKLEEIRFVLDGEPTFRVFEMVNDSAKVAEQMARLKRLR